MIVYSSTKSEFRQDVRNNKIERTILKAYQRYLGHSTSKSEIDSWKNSMMYMSNVLEDDGIPDNTGVAIEYKIPQTSKRIDIILTGANNRKQGTAVIVELKQWSEVKLTDKDGIVRTFLNGAEREVNHPSYQAWSYAALLEDFNETVQKQHISLKPCAYLHNMESESIIKAHRYERYLQKAPSFVRTDAEKLTAFIKQFIHFGDSGKIMYEIDKGKIRPSKNLADKLSSMLQGNEEFIMIDDQKLVYETALSLSEISTVKDKHVLIVDGGPGTGKSVVAINLLVALTNRRLVAQYVTKNAAPREVYESVLTGSYTKSRISNLFKGSGAYINCEPNVFDALIIDEAHRLNEKSGLFQNKGVNQIKEIIQAAKCSIFFIDEDQRVTWKDIGEIEQIKKWAKKLNTTVHRLALQSQFRCNGSDGYLAWLDHVLEIRETANKTLEGINYDFRVFDSPKKLMEVIKEKNKINNKARIVAGYCWDWVSKKTENRMKKDIVLDGNSFSAQWNLQTDGNLWIRKPESVNEIGCIHTCQGLEVDYIGVILGPDIIIRNGKIKVQPNQRAKTDQSIKGYKKALKENRESATLKAENIIKNTYRTLMSRGQKGCYIFCTDSETNEYFSALAQTVSYENNQKDQKEDGSGNQKELIADQYPGLRLKILNYEEIKPYENCIPIYDLKIAAGSFSEEQYIQDNPEGTTWVQLPDMFRHSKDLFIAQVVGESMNRRIPNGAWCLFRLFPPGSRQGKIVLVQHRDIYDSECGGHYTVKIYESEKRKELGGSWRHNKIFLKPDSTDPNFKPIVLSEEQSENLKIIAEFVAVLP